MTTKITVSLGDAAVAAAKKAVAEGRAPSVSAYVSYALAQTYGEISAAERPLAALLAELDAEYGEVPEDVRREVRDALGLS